VCTQASPEWREGQLPPELQPGSSIAGVPLDVDMLRYGPSAVAAPRGAMLAVVLGSNVMQRCVRGMDSFVRSWAGDETLLNSQLYEPALGDASARLMPRVQQAASRVPAGCQQAAAGRQQGASGLLIAANCTGVHNRHSSPVGTPEHTCMTSQLRCCSCYCFAAYLWIR
jgi:hypothetical protein